MKKPPTYLAICAMGVLLGLFGAWRGGVGVAQPWIQRALSDSAPRSLTPYAQTMATSSVDLVINLALLVACILLLTSRRGIQRRSRQVLGAAFVWTALGAMLQSWSLVSVSATDAGRDAGIDRVHAFATTLHVCLVLGWALVKLLYFGGAMVYFGRAEVQALDRPERPSSEDPPDHTTGSD